MPEPLTDRQAYLILNSIPDLGPVGVTELLAQSGGDPRAVLAGLGDWRRHFDLAREERLMAEHGVDFITRADAAFPRLLREIHTPPIGLYRRGTYAFGQACIAVIGSRRSTHYGREVAHRLGAELAALGFCVVSGLARGIDTAAHEGALSVGGKTAGVLGTGPDIVFPPENGELFRRVAEAGAVLSEFGFGRPGDKQSFPIRNRIVSGMSEAVVVVESAANGGAMITARLAGEQGRTLFAVPGRIDQPTSDGCHQLIRDGATLLTSVDDIISELNYLGGLRPGPILAKGSAADPAQRVFSPLTADEATLLACFEGGEILAADALAAKTGFRSSQLSALLMMLELKRLLVKRLDGAYEASSPK